MIIEFRYPVLSSSDTYVIFTVGSNTDPNDARYAKLEYSSTRPTDDANLFGFVPADMSAEVVVTRQDATNQYVAKMSMNLSTAEAGAGDATEQQQVCFGPCPPFQRTCPQGKSPACDPNDDVLRCV